MTKLQPWSVSSGAGTSRAFAYSRHRSLRAAWLAYQRLLWEALLNSSTWGIAYNDKPLTTHQLGMVGVYLMMCIERGERGYKAWRWVETQILKYQLSAMPKTP